MKIRFDKYWGKIENMSPFIFIANAFDLKYKFSYIKWSFENIYGKNLVGNMVKQAKDAMVKMYEWYVIHYRQLLSFDQDKQTLES